MILTEEERQKLKDLDTLLQYKHYNSPLDENGWDVRDIDCEIKVSFGTNITCLATISSLVVHYEERYITLKALTGLAVVSVNIRVPFESFKVNLPLSTLLIDAFTVVQEEKEINIAIYAYGNEVIFQKNGLGITQSGDGFGLMNHAGETVAEPTFIYIGEFNRFGLAKVKMHDKIHSGEGFINEEGKLVITSNAVSEFNESGYAPMYYYSSGWGLINTKGISVVYPSYNSIVTDDAGMFLVEKNRLDGWGDKVCEDKLYGYLDREGKELIEPIYKYVESFRSCEGSPERLARICTWDDKWGMINDRGETVVTPQFISKPEIFAKGLIKVISNSGYKGLVDLKGTSVVSFDRLYLSIDFIWENDLIRVETGSGYGLINYRGMRVASCNHRSIERYDDAKHSLRLINKYGTILYLYPENTEEKGEPYSVDFTVPKNTERRRVL